MPGVQMPHCAAPPFRNRASSACASGSGRTSHVLEAIGLSQKKAKASIRLGWGRYTTMDGIETAAAKINAAAKEQGV